MCGRYALFQAPSAIRQQFRNYRMAVDEAPDDDDVRQTYNFAPGNIGLVYRADVPDWGSGPRYNDQDADDQADLSSSQANNEDAHSQTKDTTGPSEDTHYKLQAMKWGLVPSWTKRSPDYSTIMRTINCRDDSLAQASGMWVSMKKRKRCIVICQGFFEWLKKNNGKDRIPHYIKRKDGELMLLAGLWDCVKYDDDSGEKNYTYAVITTDNNKQMSFLHDRMPVIFEPGSEELRAWLDPDRHSWTTELQSLLKPFSGELDIYQVNKDVGKVGNNSPSFIIPINSKENKSNIANFFGNQQKKAKAKQSEEDDTQPRGDKTLSEGELDGHEASDVNTSVGKAHFLATPPKSTNLKREHEATVADDGAPPSASKAAKLSPSATAPTSKTSPTKQPTSTGARKMHSATSNGTTPKASPSKASQGSQKITSFFKKGS